MLNVLRDCVGLSRIRSPIPNTRPHVRNLPSRWGSYEAFELEMSIRKAKAEASYEPRKQAFHDQAPGAAEDSAGSVPPNGEETSGHHQAADKPRRAPSRPRILGVENETNLVGVNQQERHVIGGEKYGFYTVVNDAYFDRGPTVSIFLSVRVSSDGRGRVDAERES